MFAKMARHQSRLYDAVYGKENLNGRLNAIGRMGEIHEESPEYFAASFLAEMWERAVCQYCTCVAEGIYHIIGRYEEGVTLEKIRRYALSPSSDGGTAWGVRSDLRLRRRKRILEKPGAS